MALPIKPNNPEIPIPNNPFSAPLNPYLQGPYFPFVAGPGVDLSTPGLPTITNDVAAVLSAGSGISLSTTGGITTITATGGGGLGTVTSVTAGTGLTGGTITTSGTIALANTAVTAGAYTSANITIDAQGRITAAANGSGSSGTVTSITAGTGLSGGTITTSGTVDLANTAVTAGAYTYGSFTVDAQGRLTAASSGTAPVTNVTGTAPITSTGGATPAIGLADTAVTPGAYTYASLTVDAQGRLTAASSGTAPVTAVTGNAPVSVTSGLTPVVSIAAASTTVPGAVQLYNNTDSNSTTLALTAAQGKNLQDQITALAVTSNITLGGTYDANTGLVSSVTTQGTTAGLVVGSALPAPGVLNNEIFVIVDVQGTNGPNSPTLAHVGDWYLSDGTTWQFLNVGDQPGAATTTTAGIVCLSTDALAQAGTDATTALTPAAGASAYVAKSALTAKGAILGASAACTPSALAVGSDGQMLVACASTTTGLCWVAQPAAAIPCSTITGKGSIVTGTAASTPTALSVGADNQMLVACNAAASGLCWIAQPAAAIPCSLLSAKGTLITTSTPTTPVTLAVGTDGQILYANSACATGLEWGVRPITCQDFDAKGDLLVGTADNAFTALGVGADAFVLTADAACASGVKWAAAGGASAATPTVAGIVLGCTVAGSTALGCNSLLSRTGGIGNIAIGDAALCSSTSAQISIAIGDCALKSLTTTNGNIAIGYTSLCSNTSGTGNVGLGNGTLVSNLTGTNNISIGPNAMRFATGNSSIGIGVSSLSTNAGNANVALGGGTGSGVTSGSCNTFLGGSSGANIDTGSCNVFVGTNSGAATDVSCCLSINVDTLSWLTGDNTGAIKPAAGIIDFANSCGADGQLLMSNGANAICWGTNTAIPCACITGKGALITGTAADTLSTLPAGGDGCVLVACSTASRGICWGNPAFAMTNPSTRGGLIGCTTTNATYITALGTASIFSNTSGKFLAALGTRALYCNTSGCCSSALGVEALLCNTTGSNNTAVGYGASYLSTTGSLNVSLGFCAGYNVTTGSQNVALGPNVQLAADAASCQLAIGFSATENWLTGDSTKAIKPGAGIIDSANSCGTDGQVLMSNGSNAICWGDAGGSAATPIARGTVFACTPADGTGEGPVTLGFNAGVNDGADCNTWLGYQAGTGHTTGVGNTSVGWNSARNLILGDDNVAVGNSALEVSGATASTTVQGNTAIGAATLYNTVGCFNTAVGLLAGYNQSAGSRNVLIGYFAQGQNTTGDCQLAIGFSSADYWLTGDSTKAIKPGAGIIDCANSCGTAGQVLTSTGANALQWASAPTNWTAAGTVQVVGLSATTSGPSIGTAGFNQVYYRSMGAKMWQVSLVLEKAAGGVDGSGDYLFTLPNGLQFDTTLQNQRLWTGDVGSSNNDLILLGLQGSTGAINQSPSLSTILQPVIWSATQYRLITNLSGSYRAWGSGMFNMGAQKYATTQFQFQST